MTRLSQVVDGIVKYIQTHDRTIYGTNTRGDKIVKRWDAHLGAWVQDNRDLPKEYFDIKDGVWRSVDTGVPTRVEPEKTQPMHTVTQEPEKVEACPHSEALYYSVRGKHGGVYTTGFLPDYGPGGPKPATNKSYHYSAYSSSSEGYQAASCVSTAETRTAKYVYVPDLLKGLDAKKWPQTFWMLLAFCFNSAAHTRDTRYVNTEYNAFKKKRDEAEAKWKAEQEARRAKGLPTEKYFTYHWQDDDDVNYYGGM